MAGSQDNGTSILNENGWLEWNGGDGMEAIVHTLNSDWMMGSWQYGTRQVTKDGGVTRQGTSNPEAGSGDWQAPLLYDPNHQMRVYSFADSIWKSEEFGSNWTLAGSPRIGSISVATIAENNSQIMIISSGSTVRISDDGGASFRSPGIGLPNFYVTDIAIDPKHDSTIIVTYNKYQLDGKKVYISHDLGVTWTNITYNLVDMPIRTVVIDHTEERNIYLGAEIGVYVKAMNESTWEYYSNGLPNVTVKDLEIQYASNTLKASSWGRGLWEIPLKNRASHPAILHTNLSHAPSTTQPRAGYAENVTSIIKYDQNITSAFVKWSNDSWSLHKTIMMTNVSDSTWVTDEPFTLYGNGTEMYFKVFAIGENNDTTETYKYHYTVRNGLNVNSVVESDFESSVTLYPNPNSGNFHISLGADYENVEFNVIDVSGKLVEKRMDSGNDFDFSFNLPKGIYFIEAITVNRSAKFKFVVN
jgi:hypothetical protein